MAIQFDPPSWYKPNEHEYIGQAAKGIEGIFNSYQQAKMKGQERGLGLAMQGIEPTNRPSDPESVYGQLIAKHRATRDEKSAESAASIRKDTAQAGLYDAQASALGNSQIYVDPDSGRQIVVPKGAKLIPRAPGQKTANNQDLEAALNLYETAKEGLVSGLAGTDTGPIIGRLPALTSGQQVATASVAAMAPVLKQLFRVAGEGVFTDRDQALLLNMIPGRTESPEARASIIQNIDNIVKAKLRQPQNNSSQATTLRGQSNQQEIRRQAKVNGQVKTAVYTSQGKFLRYE